MEQIYIVIHMLITKKNSIIVLGKDLLQEINRTIYAEKLYKMNFTETFLHYNNACIIMEQTVIYLLMVQKSISLKQKTLKL